MGKVRFDSGLEERLYGVLKACAYHCETIPYVQTKTYEPDFVYYWYDDIVYIEVKGRFRTADEARKYIDIRDCLGYNEHLVFIFQNPKTPMPGSRKRRDGTRYSMAEWAERHGFVYYSVDNIPKEYCDG